MLNLQKRLNHLSNITFSGVVAVSTLVLFAWWFNLEWLTRVVSGEASMKFNTALCFLILAVVFFEMGERFKQWRLIRMTGLLLVVMISGLTLAQYLFGTNLGIDESIISDSMTSPNLYPGRMSVNTALCFLFLGIAGFYYPAKTRSERWISQLLYFIVLCVSQLALIGYLFGSFDKFNIESYATMAMHTAMLFWILSFVQLVKVGFASIRKLLFRQDKLSRQVAVILVGAQLGPILIAWAVHLGSQWGLYNQSFEISLNILIDTILLVGTSLYYIPVISKYHVDLEEKVELQREQIEFNKFALERHEKALMTIAESINEAIVSSDESGQIIFWNNAAEKIFGYDFIEIIGRPIAMLIPDKHREGHIKGVENARMKKPSRVIGKVVELSGMRKNGEEFPLELSLSKWESNGRNYYSAVIRDITARKEIENKISEQRNLIIQSLKMKSLGEMAGGIAHEINTPLGAINLFAAQIKNMIKLERYEDAAKKSDSILAVVDRISRIIKGLRNFARDGDNDPIEEFSIETLVDDTLPMLKEKMSSNGVEVIVGENLDLLLVQGIRVQCSQALLNLLGNSLHAVMSYDVKWIRLEAIDQKNTIALKITDSGKGISKEVAPKVMDPFFTTKGVGVGTGLGLSISKGIIESQGGKLWLDTKAKNTCFVLELPKAIKSIQQATGS